MKLGFARPIDFAAGSATAGIASAARTFRRKPDGYKPSTGDPPPGPPPPRAAPASAPRPPHPTTQMLTAASTVPTPLATRRPSPPPVDRATIAYLLEATGESMIRARNRFSPLTRVRRPASGARATPH